MKRDNTVIMRISRGRSINKQRRREREREGGLTGYRLGVDEEEERFYGLNFEQTETGSGERQDPGE